MAQPILAGIALSVSTSPLNDQEPSFQYLRWPIVELTDYLNQGLIEICNYRPDAFMTTANLTLVAGSQQSLLTLAPGTRLLKSLNFNATSLDSTNPPITAADLSLMRTYYKAPCMLTNENNGYRVLTYGYDAKNPYIFYVSPPVPVGNTQVVNATVVAEPTQYVYSGGGPGNPAWTPSTDLALDQMYYTALRFFMAARAFEVDTESATSQSESEKFYKKFYNLLGVNYKQATEYNAGKYLGQGSDHRMTKERVA